MVMDSDPLQAGKETQADKAKPQAEAAFRTPEEVAADDRPARSNPIQIDPPMYKKQKKSWKEKFALHWPPGKKEWIVALVVVLLIGGGIAVYALTRSQPPTLQPIPKITPKSKTVPSTLTGLPVDPIVNKRTVTGVMIENSIFARPQAGLSQAGVVFEAIAEGGVTRFLALYQDTAPSNVGPIRSARPYYEQWALGFDAGYAHVGGSPDGLKDIKKWGLRDLDEFYSPNYYHRISSRDAPHNVYTSIHKLNELEVAKGYDTSHFSGFVRKAKAESHRPKPTATGIDFTLSGPVYDVHYTYDSKINSYNRSEGGQPHIDSNTGKRISPTVVIGMVMHYSLGALDTSGAYYSEYSVIGGGPVYVFQDGGVTKGTWHKNTMTSQIVFDDASGKPIKLNPGQTWITALAGTNDVSYKP